MTEKQSKYMASGLPRNEGDFYPTIDTRCVDGLLHHFPIQRSPSLGVVDVCAPSGSGIVDQLQALGVHAWGVGEAICDTSAIARVSDGKPADWIITNTPYLRGVVDRIIKRQIERVENGEVDAACFLLRKNFDGAASRRPIFSSRSYLGKIELCFRPWWTESRDKSPFHLFTWFIFKNDGRMYDPVVLYYYPPYEKRYAADVHKFKCVKCGEKSRIKYTSKDLISACWNCADPEYSIKEK